MPCTNLMQSDLFVVLRCTEPTSITINSLALELNAWCDVQKTGIQMTEQFHFFLSFGFYEHTRHRILLHFISQCLS